MKITHLIQTSALTFALYSCTPAFQGEYTDPNEVEVLTDKWNETDARKSSEILIKSMIEKPWLEDYRSSHKGEKPFVIVADIENRTDEHIDTMAIMEAIRSEVINSGRVRFVDGENRKKILSEINYQTESGHVSEKSAKKKGNQIGADFILTGNLSSIPQVQGGLKTVTYQVVLQLSSIETAEIVWDQKYTIKKKFKRSGAGF